MASIKTILKAMASEVEALEALSQLNWYSNPTLRAAIALRDGNCCAYCGLEIGTADEPVSLDHIAPQSRGGKHAPSNLVAVCKHCNSQKGAQSFERAFRLHRSGARQNSRPDGRLPYLPGTCKRNAEERAARNPIPALLAVLEAK